MQSDNTKSSIAGVFCGLLKEKNINKITVKDIVEGCGITRQAFYYHFKDILDLIEWIFKRMFEISFENIEKEESPGKVLEGLINISLENNDFVIRLLKFKDREAIEKIIMKTIRDFVKQGLDEAVGENITPNEAEIAADFYSFGLAGAVLGICSKEDSDIESCAEILIKILEKGLLLRK